jgi:hypothetical protein
MKEREMTKATDAAVSSSPTTTVVATETTVADPIIIDLGKKSRKKVKQLRKGRGQALQDLRITIGELRASGLLDADAQPVCLIVRQKSKAKGRFGLF